ncbi:MAG: protein adenylyltransferase SelO [Candidatus Thiodiazotropha sp. 6PLUC5]
MEFSNSYTTIGTAFFKSVPPEPVKDPKLFLWNSRLAEELQLGETGELPSEELIDALSGNTLLPGSEPVALAYAGHQFGNFVPQLGDGRAHLLGEIVDQSGERRDVQLKGSGPTPFSRSGDGRYALGPAIREFVMGEAIHALGIPTTRSLAVTTTGEIVFRETAQQGAVLTRIAASHLRVGSFEYFAARQNLQALEQLCDYAILRHYPELQEHGEERFLLLLEKVMKRQIDLVVEWMRVGFIHGVMNTDNTAISGETIDYGPCAMMGTYDPNTVFSSIDRQGRYAFANQPSIAQWNMARFAESLLPLIDNDEKNAIDKAGACLETFSALFKDRYHQMMARKIGISQTSSSDQLLISSLLDKLKSGRLDYTDSFHRLTLSFTSPVVERALQGELTDWYDDWRARLQQQPVDIDPEVVMKGANPVVIPRNRHMEQVIQSCTQQGDASAAEDFLDVLLSPYQLTEKTHSYQKSSADEDLGYRTFCGT